VSTGGLANHGDNLVEEYDVNPDGSVTLYLIAGTITPPSGPSVSGAYFDNISVLDNTNGANVTILTPSNVGTNGSSIVTIPASAITVVGTDAEVVFTFHLNVLPPNHVTTVILKLETY
jgi:hypothetical protein